MWRFIFHDSWPLFEACGSASAVSCKCLFVLYIVPVSLKKYLDPSIHCCSHVAKFIFLINIDLYPIPHLFQAATYYKQDVMHILLCHSADINITMNSRPPCDSLGITAMDIITEFMDPDFFHQNVYYVDTRRERFKCVWLMLAAGMIEPKL